MRYFTTILFLFLLTTLFFSCRKTRGCTDPEALNYNLDARKDDHSCYYFWVGQSYGGGRVFYVDQSKKHGLIAAEFDFPLTEWGCSGTSIEGADGLNVGTGLQNTIDIVNGCSSVNAASLCNDLDTLGYNDWYLPSLEEMKGIYETLGTIGQAHLGSGYYWTSSEIDSDNAWQILFANGASVTGAKSTGYSVRAIRSF